MAEMNVLRFILGMMCILGISVRLAAENTQQRPESDELGLTIDSSNGQLIKVDRSRSYGSLKLEGVKTLSTAEEEVEVVKGGKKEKVNLALFGEVKVKQLCFTDSIQRVNTKSLRGVKGLEEIVFEGAVPAMEEKDYWLTWGEDDWRDSLKVVTLCKDINLSKLDFAGEIKCIRFGEASQKTLQKVSRDEKTASNGLRSCGSLEKIMIPFELAKDSEIKWNDILKLTGLWDDIVVSDANE